MLIRKHVNKLTLFYEYLVTGTHHSSCFSDNYNVAPVGSNYQASMWKEYLLDPRGHFFYSSLTASYILYILFELPYKSCYPWNSRKSTSILSQYFPVFLILCERFVQAILCVHIWYFVLVDLFEFEVGSWAFRLPAAHEWRASTW